MESKSLSLEDLPITVEDLPDDIAALKAEITRLRGGAPPSGVCPMGGASTNAASKCPFLRSQQLGMEDLETGAKTVVNLSEEDASRPKHPVGCTPHECHGAMMAKTGFEIVTKDTPLGAEEKVVEMKAFITQFWEEVTPDAPGLSERLAESEKSICETGTYEHTFEELEYGCRLAWRNAGRCIMRKVSFSLQLRDFRHVSSAQECFDSIVEHLKFAANGGVVIPTITVFKPRNGNNGIRVWNPQLLSYACYEREDGTTLGDPGRLDFTNVCIAAGWVPPALKSDFDVLPILISSEGSDVPEIFQLPKSATLEIPIEHPNYPLFSKLNLRWYALPAISEQGVDIGGVFYQSCPFSGWYAVTEISRDLLDVQRYNLKEAVAAACHITTSKANVWQDDVQLQMHKAILHSFSKRKVSIIDHHTASESFGQFYKEEVAARGRCPGDWVWVVPPAGSAMTQVFHQEMVNFIVKPQYCVQKHAWLECGMTDIPKPAPLPALAVDTVDTSKILYGKCHIFYGSQMGASSIFAHALFSKLGDKGVLPKVLDDLPGMLARGVQAEAKQVREKGVAEADDDSGPTEFTRGDMVLIVCSTYGKGNPPTGATHFMGSMTEAMQGDGLPFAMLALGNSAYVDSFVQFGKEVCQRLEERGFRSALPMAVADERKDQSACFDAWFTSLTKEEGGVLFTSAEELANAEAEAEAEAKSTDAPAACQESSEVTVTYLGSSDLTGSAEEYARKRPNTALFTFDVPAEYGEGLSAGDHMAIFPCNPPELVAETVSKMAGEPDEEQRRKLRSVVELGKPLSVDVLQELMVSCEAARDVVSGLIETADETHQAMPSVEVLLEQLPTGTLTLEWVMEHTPLITPRFYSIAYCKAAPGGEHMSICQDTCYFVAGGSTRAGATTRYLRSLQAGDSVRVMLNSTKFHLPQNSTATVVGIATGSGLAPLRGFWTQDSALDKGSIRRYVVVYGCRTKKDLLFGEEVQQLEAAGALKCFVAYSREVGIKHQYVQDVIVEQADSLLPLLYSSLVKFFFCGSPKVEEAVQEALLAILVQGSSDGVHPPRSVLFALRMLLNMEGEGRFIKEVFGASSANAEGRLARLLREEVKQEAALYNAKCPAGLVSRQEDSRKPIMHRNMKHAMNKLSTARWLGNASALVTAEDQLE